MAASSMTFTFFTTKNYQAEISNQHYKLVKETLESTIRVIDKEYNDLLTYEINAINNQRSLMKNIGTSILSMVDSFYVQQKTGFLNEQQAKENCLKRLNAFRYQNNNYFFVYDLNLTGLSHPDKEMVGQNWSGFEDLRKRDALSLIRKILKTKDQTFTVFMWPRREDMKQVKQIGFFLYYPKWEWIIGTANELNDIEKISQAQEKNALSKLNNKLSHLSLNEIGGVLVFDSHGNIITCSSNLKINDLNCPEKILSKSVQGHLKNAAKDPGKPVEYRFTNRSQKKITHIAYADYYKSMDWYVSAFVDKEEGQKVGSAIATRQFIIFALVSLLGIIFAAVISKKIMLPLSLLSKYARDLPDNNFTIKNNQSLEYIVSSTRDAGIKQLADSFAYMETRLGENFQALEKKTNDLKQLNEHILYIEEEGRKAIASDLHDSVAQTLALSISKIKNIPGKDHQIDLQTIAEIQDFLEQAVKEIRSMIYELHPPVLDDFEIDIALGFLIEESNEKYGVNIKYINAIDDPVHLNKSNKIILYRAANELIINIIKHSGLKDAEIELSADEHFILLRVEDRGVGFDLNQSKNNSFYGFGTYSLSERITNLGGNFAMFSEPGKGTKILISIPLLLENHIENQKR